MPNTLAETLQKSLEGLDLLPRDDAAVRLAKHYATLLDGGADAVKMGPAYLACLEALGMTPRARAAIAGKGVAPGGTGDNPLDRLRARRVRPDGAKAMDPAAP